MSVVEQETEARHALAGTDCVGVKSLLRQNPHDMAANPKRSPAPYFHAATREMREAMVEAYNLFVGAFRDAAELLRGGIREVAFPRGSFPPRNPWVPEVQLTPG